MSKKETKRYTNKINIGMKERTHKDDTTTWAKNKKVQEKKPKCNFNFIPGVSDTVSPADTSLISRGAKKLIITKNS